MTMRLLPSEWAWVGNCENYPSWWQPHWRSTEGKGRDSAPRKARGKSALWKTPRAWAGFSPYIWWRQVTRHNALVRQSQVKVSADTVDILAWPKWTEADIHLDGWLRRWTQREEVVQVSVSHLRMLSAKVLLKEKNSNLGLRATIFCLLSCFQESSSRLSI